MRHLTTLGRISIGLLLFGAAAVAAGQAVAAGPSGKVELICRALAVKDVCAWPNLTKLDDGTVVATIFNQPCHGTWEGDVDCWATLDGGKSWAFLGRPAPHEPMTNRMNVAAGVNDKGELIVLAGGWSHRPPKGEPAGHRDPARPLFLWVCRSTDGGTTWTQRAEGIERPSKSRLAATEKLSDTLAPFGNIIRLSGGMLGVSLYGVHREAGTCDSYFFTSADDGVSWQVKGVIGKDNYNETAILRLSNGELLAVARTANELPGSEQRLELFRSTDGGAGWTFEQAVSRPLEHPADLLELADGRILLTYGDRNYQDSWKTNWPDGSAGTKKFPKGIKARISSDGGKTWSTPVRIADFDGDGGYPATVELADGRLLTAFYATKSPDYDGYHMAAVTWRWFDAASEQADASGPDQSP